MTVLDQFGVLIEEVAEKEGIDPCLLAAIIQVESAGDPFALRYEPRYKWLYQVPRFARKFRITDSTEEACQRFSVGLCQLMFALMRELKFEREFCLAFEPRLNMTYGARHLKNLASRFESKQAQISAYNAGTPTRRNGVFINQPYVDKVMHFYERFTRERGAA